MKTDSKRASTRRKVFAIAAGGAALGIGVSATLAAWTDTEWVFGGDGTGAPGLGTSTFEVEQNVVDPFTADTWANEEVNPGGEIVFTATDIDAGALTPGDAVYAQMALRAAPDSIAGTVELQPAIPADGITADDPTGLLFGALEVTVATDDVVFACDATAFAAAPGGPEIIADGPLSTTGGSAVQALAAEAGSEQFYCFEVSLPDTLPVPPSGDLAEYMGLSVAPAWEFQAES